MSNYKCTDCGQEYDSELEACPNCGCPSEYQVKQAEQTPIETEVSQDKSHTPKKGSKNKKLILIVLPIIIIAGIVAVGTIYHHKHSFEYKMVRLEKVATEFKATLGPNNQIIAEQVDSVAQKVFYLDTDEDGNLNNIKVHDYSTNETKSILPESGKIEDFEYCGRGEYKDSKLIKDRLFFTIESYCMWQYGSIGVFFANIRDNSLHYVESCNDVQFLENGEIGITKFYNLGYDEEYGIEETDNKQYTLSTSLSDEAYADNRREQKRTEERLAEEWKKRDIDKTIELDYAIDDRNHYVDYAGTLDGHYYRGRFYNSVFTKMVVVPQGKMWQFKRFTSSEYCYTPELFFHEVVNGYTYNIGLELKNHNVQILYPGTYQFRIDDLCYNTRPGHRSAKIIFTEKVY